MAQGLIILKWQLKDASPNPHTNNATPKLDWSWFYQCDAISHNFPQSLQAKSKILPDMRTQPVPSTSFPVQYSLSHNHFTSLTTLWSNKPQINKNYATYGKCLQDDARLTNLHIHRVSVTSRTSYLMPSELKPSVRGINLFIFYYILFKNSGRTAEQSLSTSIIKPIT
jgi:hypothetical protein